MRDSQEEVIGLLDQSTFNDQGESKRIAFLIHIFCRLTSDKYVRLQAEHLLTQKDRI